MSDLSRPTAPLALSEIGPLLSRQPARTLDAGNDWRHAAVAAVFRQGTHGAELLFMLRADHEKDPWSGQIGFPGGRAEATDRDLEFTAARESKEELGLQLLDRPDVQSLGPLNALQARARQAILPMAITPFAFALWQPEAPELRPNHEVAEAFWIPVADLADPARRVWYESQRVHIPFRFRALDLGRNVPLWGLTHRMVMEILERLGLVEDVDALTLPQAIG